MVLIARKFIILALLCAVTSPTESQTKRRDFQAELFKYLKNNITDCSPSLRSTIDHNEVVSVYFIAAPKQIVAVDSAKQSMKISGMFLASWFEERLVWDPNQFGNITSIDWNSSELWFPVIIVFNGLGDNQYFAPQLPAFIKSVSPTKSVVSSAWRAEWEFSCQFDMKLFPLDRHTCELGIFINNQGGEPNIVIPKQGSIVENSTIEFNELTAFNSSNEWRLLNLKTFVRNNSYEIMKGMPAIQLPTYVLSMVIERDSTYYMLNLVTPLLLLTLLQLIVFFIPIESGEKLGFGITIMLSYTVFLLLLDGLLPKSQSMPLVAYFITAAMVLSASSLLLTSVAIRFHCAAGSQTMPSCLRILFVSCLGRLLLRNQDRKIEPDEDADVHQKPVKQNVEHPSDWQLAAIALERLLLVVGCPACLIIVVAFLFVRFLK